MYKSLNRVPVVIAVLVLVVAAGPARADVQSDLFGGYQKMFDGHFASEMVSTDAGKQTRMEAQYETTRRVHVTTPDAEIILLPEGTWLKMGGEWTKPPFDVGGMVQGMMPKNVDSLRAGISNLKDEGSVDGLHAISFDQNMTFMGIKVSAHNKVFLNGAGQIVRSESSSNAMGKTSTSIQTIRYDDSIRVTAPK